MSERMNEYSPPPRNELPAGAAVIDASLITAVVTLLSVLTHTEEVGHVCHMRTVSRTYFSEPS